ncbi:MAG: S-layer homology domain-containing protein [Lachnospiraceae bacterium]|nr:S-layer homology domain-containing protein [Lachnospiraceae bacterium]MDD3615902.1 S-layer homology domain-containing protein [Lachnospiraceae bacterium]
MKKRIIALCMTAVLCLGQLTVTQAAETNYKDAETTELGESGDISTASVISGQFSYEIYDEEEKTVFIDGYLGGGTSITVPSSIDGYTVIGYSTGIEDMDDMQRLSSVTSVSLPDTLEFIQSWGFAYLQSLQEVTIPEGVKWIGGACFFDCPSLKKVVVPASVTVIYEDMFTGNECYYVQKGSYAEEFYTSNGMQVSSSGTKVSVNGCSVDQSNVYMDFEDDIDVLQASISPQNASNKHINWTSSNENVVAVDEDSAEYAEGECCPILAKGAGTATVTGQTADGGFTVSCQVTVRNDWPFEDVSAYDWFRDDVADMYLYGVMTGKSATVFAPYDNLTREEFAIMLYRLNGETDMPYANTFSDVSDGVYYTDAILWANANDVVHGYSDGSRKFGVGDPITREQMAIMLHNYAEHSGYDVSQSAEVSGFTDAYLIQDYAMESMQWAVGSGLIKGKNAGTSLDPRGNAARCECAIVMSRFLDMYEN